jgi:hypothetical protein
MSANLSTTEICNLALDYLEETPLVSFDTDTSTVAQWFRRNFWPITFALMRKHPWNFAIGRTTLAASGTPPAFGYANAYDIPSTWARVLPLTTDGNEMSQEVRYKVEGTQILTDAEAPLPVRFINKVTNTGQFDQQFVDVLAATLAQKAAHFITGKQSYAQLMGQIVQGLFPQAQMLNALEGTPDDPQDDFWVQARR